MKGILTTGALARSRRAFDEHLAGVDVCEVGLFVPSDADILQGGLEYVYKRRVIAPRGTIEKLIEALEALCSLAVPSLTQSRPRASGTGRDSGTRNTAVRSRRRPKGR